VQSNRRGTTLATSLPEGAMKEWYERLRAKEEGAARLPLTVTSG
jgi:hypothetical protein